MVVENTLYGAIFDLHGKFFPSYNYTNKCLSKLSSAGGAWHPTWTEHIMIKPRNAAAFVNIHPQVSKRETRG